MENQATDTALPRPEYPRPQFVRRDWMNLNGEWDFMPDAYDQGLRRGWHTTPDALKRKIVVPYAHQTKLSGQDDQDIYQSVWYGREVEIPAEWREGNDLLLHFGAVDYRTTVWVNNQEVGHNTGGHVPFTLDIAPYIRTGTNRIVVRAEDGQDADQPRGKQSISGRPRGIDYYCTTGIWQTVWLEPVPAMRISHLTLKPVLDIDGDDAIEVRIQLHAPSIGWDVEGEALDGDKVIAAQAKHDVGASSRLFLRIKASRRWTPETPHLYGLRVRLKKNGAVLDEVESYFGLREVQIREGSLLLNGEPTYLKMVLDQGYWPESGMTAPTDDALRADVEWCKRFGFNGVRKHQKVEDPRWLTWCDRLGLLVWGEMANARAWSPRSEERFIAEWERVVRRDSNHPCLITWVPLNESWGVPDLSSDHPGQYAFLERVVELTRRLDPDRPVIDNDGWEHTDITDIVAIHDYTPTGDGLRERYAEALGGGPIPANTWDKHPVRHFARGSRHRGQPVMLTEVGGFLMLPPDPGQKLDVLYNAYGTTRDPQQMLAQYRDLMEGIADLHFVSGFCYTQFADIEQEANGLLTYDRVPKIPPEEIASIHAQLFPTHRPSGDETAAGERETA